jgi:preprotein translocase subunit YajC
MTQKQSDALFVLVVILIIIFAILSEEGREQREIQQMLDTYPYDHSKIPTK